MNRLSNKIIKIQLVDNINFSEFKVLINNSKHEFVPFKNESGRFITFIDHPPKDLFLHRDNFKYLRGASFLYCNDKPVTSKNYMEVDLLWVTDIEPITESIE